MSQQTALETPPTNSEKEFFSYNVEHEGHNHEVDIRFATNLTIEQLKEAAISDKLTVDIYSPGFGLLSPKVPGRIEQQIFDATDQAPATEPRLAFAATIKSLPDAKLGDTFDVDAAIILKAYEQHLQKLGLTTQETANHFFAHNQTNITGYSEGAGIAIALAAQIDQLQKTHNKKATLQTTHRAEDDNHVKHCKNLPSNTLTLYSLTSLIDRKNALDTRSTSRAFTDEVLNITKSQIADKVNQMNPNDEYLNPHTRAEYAQFARRFGKAVLTHPKQSWNHLLGSTGDLGMLGNVLKRALNPRTISNLSNQLSKFDLRNDHACNQLGPNWRVNLELPSKDVMFQWRSMRYTLKRIAGKDYLEDKAEQKLPVSSDEPQKERVMVRKMSRFLFPHVGAEHVTVNFYGHPHDRQKHLDATHLLPENPSVTEPRKNLVYKQKRKES